LKKVFSLLLSVSVFCLVSAEGTVDQKVTFAPYGFVKGDMYYVSGAAKSWAKPSLTCVQVAAKDDSLAGEGIAFSAQHSRVGLKGSGAFGSITMGGLVEVDFFVIAANTNAKPRMRLAYAWCQPFKGFEIRAGQQWDLFSPLNPTTNNTNANLWYAGNYGFRRAQIYLGYTLDFDKVKAGVQVSGGEGAREDDLAANGGTWLGDDNKSGIPMIQYRGFCNLFNKAIIGFAGIYSTFGKDKDYTSTGFSADLDLPIHNFFSLKGEFAMGTNLNNSNIFTIADNKYKKIGTVIDSTDKKNMGFWVNVITKPIDFFNLSLGVAQEKNTTDKLAIGQPESNFTFYSDFIFPIGKYFSLSVEYQFLKTSHKDADDYTTNVVDLAGTVTF